MSLFKFAFRHLRRHWQLNVAVLLCLTLAAALLTSLPSYAAVVAARELDQNLGQARPAERTLLITGSRYTFSRELFEFLQEKLGELFKDRMIVRYTTLVADSLPQGEPADRERKTISYLNMYAFDRWPDSVRVVEGRLPVQVNVQEAEPHRPPPVEVVIGARAAERAGLRIGDRLTASQAYHRLDIVGMVEPLAPRDDMWGGDLSAFDIATDSSDPNVDVFSLPLILAPASMRSNFRFVPIFPHEMFWRITLNYDLISAQNARALRLDLINMQTQLGTKRAEISTGLVQILADYVERLSQVRSTLLLLTAQAFIFVLYTLTMLTSFMLDRSRIELATLSGRGASAWQITWVFALENLVLALPAALLLGPGLAQGVMRLWANVAGETVPATLPSESWLFSGVAAGLGWLALVLPVYPATRRSILDWQKLRARPSRLALAQKLYLDVFLLVLGGLLYWQLDQSGSFVTRQLGDAQLADPLLLVGPSLFLVAIAMVFLRIFPFLLRLAAWAFQRARGLVLPLGLHRLARDPLKASRVVLLISLTTGLILFTSAFGDSLSHSQEEMARYLAGADLRVSLASTDPSTQQLVALPGVLTATPVFRGSVRNNESQVVQLFAVDPATFAQVAHYPTSLTNMKLSSLMDALQPEAGADVLPAIFSFSALPPGKDVGERVIMNFAGRRLLFSVRGAVNSFPTLPGAFVMVSLADLEAQVDLDVWGARILGSHEAWLAVDPAQHEALTRRPELKERILDDAQARLDAFRFDALAQGTSGAFQLNTLTLALFSVAVFLLFHFFAAQQRVVEFGVLRAMGLSVRQLLILLATEGVLVVELGLVAGTMIGYGLSRTMIPYLSRALTEALAGVTIKHILVDWFSVAQLYLLLIAFYGLALVLLLLILVRVGVHQALRVGDE